MSTRKRKSLGRASNSEDVIETKISAKASEPEPSFFKRQPVWILLAISSGTCAAVNSVFAKMTTTALTSELASQVSIAIGLDSDDKYVNLILRGGFFGLNVLFNIAMWALFTSALTRSSSTTRVSIVNVSANFFLTAILGWLIFGEDLPPLWWLGAGLLAIGNVVIGRREEPEKSQAKVNGENTKKNPHDSPAEGDSQSVDQAKSSSTRKRK